MIPGLSGALAVGVLAATLAQGATALRAVAEQVLERVGATGGRAAVVQLERAGGRAAVEAVLVQAEREGGEALVRRTATLLSEAGAPALGVISRAPARAIAALDGLSGETLKRGVAALEREPAILSMSGDLARRAVATEARLPGVGATIVGSLGDDGARIASQLTEAQGVSMARWSKDVASLPAKERGSVLAALEKRPGVVLDYLDRHPGVLVGAAAISAAAVIEITALVSGQEGPVSAAVRGGTKIAEEALSTPLAIIVTLAGVALVALGSLWFLPSVLRRWRRAAPAE
ncbi:MAG: hypothetical protein KF724_07430 [Phycisphaeraceae bacterium]|nr:hypothetical protein [Phycisphaeraceae bacterium]